MKKLMILTTAISAVLLGCANTSTQRTGYVTALPFGEYVSEGYAKRQQGSDWVAVTVTLNDNGNEDVLAVNIHSREDIKKPTCSLKTTARAVAEGQYLANDNGTKILLGFNSGKLTVSAGKGSNPESLMSYCSGGGSIAGDYQRIKR